MLAVDVMSNKGSPDYALFSMHVQRSDVPSQAPDSILWDVSGWFVLLFDYDWLVDLFGWCVGGWVKLLCSCSKRPRHPTQINHAKTPTAPRHPQITTTLPVRMSFYTLWPWDSIRAVMEVALLICVGLVAYTQFWQYQTVKWQYGKARMFWRQFWNVFELLRWVRDGDGPVGFEVLMSVSRWAAEAW